jgi:hypothetical protein
MYAAGIQLTQNCYVGNILTVGGTATITGNTTMNSNLTVSGTATLTGVTNIADAVMTYGTVNNSLAIVGGQLSMGPNLSSINLTSNATGITSTGGFVATNYVSSKPNIFYGFNSTATSYTAGQTMTVNASIPCSYFSTSTFAFTAPFACYVKVSAEALINTSSTGPVGMEVYHGTTIANATQQYQLSYSMNGYGYQTGSGFHVMSCNAGDIIQLRFISACSVYQSNCLYEIL